MSKHRAFTFKEMVVVIAVLAVITIVFWPTCLGSGRHNARRSSCQSNLKQIALAFGQYNQDYDDKFPLVSRPEGWVGLLRPYLKTDLIFRCPSEETRGDDNLTDYWFNRRLAGVANKRIANAQLTILSGDGEPSDDPNVSLGLLPPRWMERESSPAWRHLDGGNYLFADGHVKWFKANALTTHEKGKRAPTFLPR